MQKNNFDLFPILVTRYENFLNKAEIELIKNYCLNCSNDAKRHSELHGNSSSTHSYSSNIIEELDSKVFQHQYIASKIKNVLFTFSMEYGYEREVKLTNSWFNIQNEGSILKLHDHPESVFSGALFINADQFSSKLYFSNPNTLMNYISLKSNTRYGYKNFYIDPVPGSLVLFPSLLKHGSNYNQNDTPQRLVISFNTTSVQN